MSVYFSVAAVGGGSRAGSRTAHFNVGSAAGRSGLKISLHLLDLAGIAV